MIVTIKESVFKNIKFVADLNDLLPFFTKGKHRMNLKKSEDFLAFENSTWIKTLSRSDRDLLRESNGRIDKKEIIVSDSDDPNEFNTKEAYFYLGQNLQIILEQILYEKPFILKIIQEFDPTNEVIIALQNHWLHFYNGAGSNSESILKDKITRDETTNSHFKYDLNKYLRFYEIKDSDREYCIINEDGSITLPDYKDPSKIRFLEQNNIPYHILYKREKENYMPDSVFNGFMSTGKKNDQKKKFSKIYLRFTKHQKDFFDLEKGFLSKSGLKEKNLLSPEIKRLYSKLKDDKELSDEEYIKIGSGLKFSHFKSDFSNEFKNVSKLDLEKRIMHQPLLSSKVNPNDISERNEFEHLIREIKYLL